MWVFDGEEWTQDSGNEHATVRPERPETQRPRYEELVPELQVVEIVQVPRLRKDKEIPPFPLP